MGVLPGRRTGDSSIIIAQCRLPHSWGLPRQPNARAVRRLARRANAPGFDPHVGGNVAAAVAERADRRPRSACGGSIRSSMAKPARHIPPISISHGARIRACRFRGAGCRPRRGAGQAVIGFDQRVAVGGRLVEACKLAGCLCWLM